MECPFWDSKKGEYPDQEDGYCHYLGKSDWDINEERQHTSYVVSFSKNKELEGKSVYEVFDGPLEIDPISGKTMHFGMSLLWDQCKECGVNTDDPEGTVYYTMGIDMGFPEEVLKSLKNS